MPRFHVLVASCLMLTLLRSGAGSTTESLKRQELNRRAAPAVKKKQPIDDSGVSCLLLLCRNDGVKATLAELKRLSNAEKRRPTLADLEHGGRAKGLNLAVTRVTATALERQRGTGIAWTDRSNYVAFGPADGNQAWLHDPISGRRRTVSYAEIVGRSQGLVLLHVRSRLHRLD
jgi:ABC-type bacteriocin/lantibiotic exporter with double-glycine peptidase domain